MRTIALIGCAAQKLDRRAPARELYVSALFQLALQYAEAVLGAEVFILSAQHGLVRPDQELAPYDLSLADLEPWERAWWAHEVEAQFAEVLGAQMVPSRRPGAGVCDAEWALEQPGVRLVLLAGQLYRFTPPFPLTFEEPLSGMGIGSRKQWLRQQVEAVRRTSTSAEARTA